MANVQLANVYDDVNRSKADRLRECARLLVFNQNVEGSKKLYIMNSCHVRLCPMCAWRRSKKIYYHQSKIMDAMADKNYEYIFITFTVRNCYGNELNDLIDEMMRAWHKFSHDDTIESVIKGWYRGLEIIHNLQKGNQYYNTYHPHFHCLFAVDKSYFSGRDYLTKNHWAQIWQRVMRVDYNPVVHVKKVKGNTARAVAELAKYSVKDTDYLIPNDWNLTIETVSLLDEVLDGRHLVAYGGEMKECHKKLNLDDEIDGDLIHVEDKEGLPDDLKYKIAYIWNTGYTQYLRKF